MTMLRTIDPMEMKRIETQAFAAGVPSILLMENAARAVCDALDVYQGAPVLFVAGAGNNGGDALAAARMYALRGGKAVAWLPMGCKTEDAQKNLAYLRLVKAEIHEGKDCPDVEGLSAVADGLLGTGLTGEAHGEAKNAIEAINALHVPVVAIDVPSGIDARSGSFGACVRAAHTVTFHRPKPGLYLTRKREYVGRITVADIGLPACMDDATGYLVSEEKDINVLLPARSMDAHKGDCGRVLIRAGSMGMAGAAAMAAKAALRAGAGLVTVQCDTEIMPILQTLVPNAMCVDRGQIVPHDAYLAGCGVQETLENWQEMLSLHDENVPSVWDAGALNLLAKHPAQLGEKAVLTPHPGEAARLLDCTVSEVLDDMVGAAQRIRAKYGCGVVALKSSVTVIAGEEIALNCVGTPALAKGGSGDALAGIIAALLAGGMEAFDACRCACLWHGLAARRAAEMHGVRGVLTGEVIDAL